MNEATPVINEIFLRGRVHERQRARIMRRVFAAMAFGVMAFGLSQL